MDSLSKETLSLESQNELKDLFIKFLLDINIIMTDDGFRILSINFNDLQMIRPYNERNRFSLGYIDLETNKNYKKFYINMLFQCYAKCCTCQDKTQYNSLKKLVSFIYYNKNNSLEIIIDNMLIKFFISKIKPEDELTFYIGHYVFFKVEHIKRFIIN